MKITNILKEKKVLLSFEIFPPKQQANFDNVVSAAKELSALNPDFMSITWGAGGTTKGNTVEIASKLIGFGTPALAHLTCVGNTKNEVEKVIAKMKANKIENVLALRGDIPQNSDSGSVLTEGLTHASDLVRILKDHDM